MHEKLKYLFTVIFQDGSRYLQNAKDIPKGPRGSCYTDVLEKEKTVPIHQFIIKNKTNTFVVDLTDGSFYINGQKILLYEYPLKDYRLIFFRKHRQHKTPGLPDVHETFYQIGWQTNLPNGDNIQRVLTVE